MGPAFQHVLEWQHISLWKSLADIWSQVQMGVGKAQVMVHGSGKILSEGRK